MTKQELEHLTAEQLWDYYLETDSAYAYELLEDRHEEDLRALERAAREEERGLNDCESQRQDI